MTVVERDVDNVCDKQVSAIGAAEQQMIQSFRRLRDDEKRRILRLVDLLIYHPDGVSD
ncbi:hypothetical protein ALP22_03476 [Pseudomonas coronafaciens pv. porri]|uniref:hypothetical protein n=1 Tax=Pseudomonas syringae group TaxID=136849 RepID=UPI0004259677|nr:MULTISPECIES: hypothetical protein [Pseudomonas syringae group]MCF5713397.1 hypothetical protein [Pseudomonas tremae]RMU89357.1 hypothetical protein ALP22_03476 [Pseudomonas coronafaciens pv. porri]UQB31395.1 hypothetical protein I9H06_24510 [Pseudomonas tremae]